MCVPLRIIDLEARTCYTGQMAKKSKSTGPAGSLRALGGDGREVVLENAQTTGEAMTILNSPPDVAAHIAITQGDERRDLLRLMMARDILTEAQYVLITQEACRIAREQPKETQAQSRNNALLWDIAYKARLSMALIEALPSDGGIDATV